jgi:hypothetical protein
MKKPNSIVSHKSSFAEIDIPIKSNEEIVTLERLKGVLKKQKSKLVIETYICCEYCQAEVGSEPIKVGKNYLENSFYYFLSLLDKVNSDFLLAEKEVIKEKATRSGQKKARKFSMEKCDHDYLIRVFEYSGCMVKFSVRPIEKYWIYEINLKTEEGKNVVSMNEKRHLMSLR